MLSSTDRERYIDLFGFYPEAIDRRIKLAQAAGCGASIDVVESWRTGLLHDNPLDRKTQQLVHWGMTLALSDSGPALVHARAALHAGASLKELYGVCMTAGIMFGMPGYGRSIRILQQAIQEDALWVANSNVAGPELTASQLSGIQGSTAPKVHVIDVRSAEEYQAGHVPGSLSFPLVADIILAAAPAGGQLVLIADDDKTANGVRALLSNSDRAASILSGGFQAWRVAGLPVLTS